MEDRNHVFIDFIPKRLYFAFCSVLCTNDNDHCMQAYRYSARAIRGREWEADVHENNAKSIIKCHTMFVYDWNLKINNADILLSTKHHFAPIRGGLITDQTNWNRFHQRDFISERLNDFYISKRPNIIIYKSLLMHRVAYQMCKYACYK